MTDAANETTSPCPLCPECSSEYSFQVGALKVCAECAHEWTPAGPGHDGLSADL